jgi:hypothetical protein
LIIFGFTTPDQLGNAMITLHKLGEGCLVEDIAELRVFHDGGRLYFGNCSLTSVAIGDCDDLFGLGLFYDVK